MTKRERNYLLLQRIIRKYRLDKNSPYVRQTVKDILHYEKQGYLEEPTSDYEAAKFAAESDGLQRIYGPFQLQAEVQP